MVATVDTVATSCLLQIVRYALVSQVNIIVLFPAHVRNIKKYFFIILMCDGNDISLL